MKPNNLILSENAKRPGAGKLRGVWQKEVKKKLAYRSIEKEFSEMVFVIFAGTKQLQAVTLLEQERSEGEILGERGMEVVLGSAGSFQPYGTPAFADGTDKTIQCSEIPDFQSVTPFFLNYEFLDFLRIVCDYFNFQISSLYWRIVRSDEKKPAFAIFTSIF